MKIFATLIIPSIALCSLDTHAKPYNDYIFELGDSSGSGDGVLLIVGVVWFLSIFGGWKTFRIVSLCILGVIAAFMIIYGYCALLVKLGVYIQTSILELPNPDPISWTGLLVFIIGWFGPIYLYSRYTDK
jgi:hypothetical protein